MDYDAYSAEYGGLRCRLEDEFVVDVLRRFVPLRGLVLDLACGQGAFHAAMGAHRVIGVDADEEMIRRCDSGAVCLVGKYDEWPGEVSGREFVAVTNFFGMYGSMEALLRMRDKAFEALVPGGVVVFVAFGRGREDVEFSMDALRRWGEYVQFTPDDMRSFLRGGGFEVELVAPLSSGLLVWLGRWMPGWIYRIVYRVLRHMGWLEWKFFRPCYVVGVGRKPL